MLSTLGYIEIRQLTERGMFREGTVFKGTKGTNYIVQIEVGEGFVLREIGKEKAPVEIVNIQERFEHITGYKKQQN